MNIIIRITYGHNISMLHRRPLATEWRWTIVHRSKSFMS